MINYIKNKDIIQLQSWAVKRCGFKTLILLNIIRERLKNKVGGKNER